MGRLQSITNGGFAPSTGRDEMTRLQKEKKEKILENEKVIDDLLQAWINPSFETGGVLDTYQDAIGLLEVGEVRPNTDLEIYVEVTGADIGGDEALGIEWIQFDIDWKDLSEGQRQTILQEIREQGDPNPPYEPDALY